MEGILQLFDEALRPAMREPLEITTLIGRLIARATNEAQAASISDLGASGIDILAALASRGAPFRAKPGELAVWSGVTGAAITTRVDRLERRGMVERTVDPKDRRIRWINLTDAGNDVLHRQAVELTTQPLFLNIQSLSEKEASTLCAILRKLT
ncbi:MarR transcriptional regulator [Novosphingobium sp. Rr 2-17]|uniref:MarR family winged helix-turn-helix transcriptional regulator n=1 Tax=Novosphingobium sp. Rr 2-17 TaxID=555793 RepID=UPI0002699ED8|nr:MarR family transcriptional regulator [Novosphingobium sp. Rr 2-17]EIZ79136.1 MarR transcriptional regulator [Novosphingobium sp. Rr 2-17]